MDIKNILAKKIAGEVTISKTPGKTLRKWREIFGIKQYRLADIMEISTSVVSDYESGRRKSPGVEFIKRYVEALIDLDEINGSTVVKKFSRDIDIDAIMDIREFLEDVPATKIQKLVKGVMLVNKNIKDIRLNGYTVIDSIKAITDLSESDFIKLYGLSTNRALIFTKVHMGRSPMIAIKVTKPKPSMVIMHGLKPGNVDKLGINIAKIENIPLMVSTLEHEEDLIKNLRGLNT
ncbi:MAG: helix-turn-helix domain-containing protein [Candidatus Altiarchaeota archaeon]|nr:helix-turn-helix domain-containing protein [Candidatus Altiarchaeota archaeon]